MPILADYYVDNNETIYASVRLFSPSTAASQHMHTYLDIGSLLTLTGQSTVFVNWLRFEFQGTVSNGGVGYSYGSMLSGIVPLSVSSASNPRPDYVDYEDVKGWPFKNSKKMYYAYAGDTANSGNMIRMVHTFKPRKALLMNRQQAIITTFENNHGQAVKGLLTITAQLKRGD